MVICQGIIFSSIWVQQRHQHFPQRVGVPVTNALINIRAHLALGFIFLCSLFIYMNRILIQLIKNTRNKSTFRVRTRSDVGNAQLELTAGNSESQKLAY